MRTSRTKPSLCTTCDVETGGRPAFHVGLPFCCAGCVAGGPCGCSYDSDRDEDVRVRHCRDIASLIHPSSAHRAEPGPTRAN